MGRSSSPEVVNSLAMGSLPGYLEEVLHLSPGWGDLSCPRVVAEGGALEKAWVMEIPEGRVYLEWSQERHDWEARALSKRLANFDLCLRRTAEGLELKWLWPRGKFRSGEVDRVLGRGLKKIIREKGGTEVCLLGGIFHLVLGPNEVSITMQVATGENGGLWSETVPYHEASELLVDVQSFLEGSLGKAVF